MTTTQIRVALMPQLAGDVTNCVCVVFCRMC